MTILPRPSALRRAAHERCGALGTAATGTLSSAPPTSAEDTVDQLAEIMVEAQEPRFVTPTRRDQIGRIWGWPTSAFSLISLKALLLRCRMPGGGISPGEGDYVYN